MLSETDLTELETKRYDVTLNEEETRNKIRRKKKRNEHGSIAWHWPLIILGLGCLLYYCVYLIDNILPDTVSIRDAEQNPNIFCGERSVKILRQLTSLGQRVVGSVENEVLSPELIISEIQDIMRTAHYRQSILYEVQKGDGSFELGFNPPNINIYQNIKNLMVKLEGSDGTHSVLVNCHYDTVPSSEGAADDGINCAVMLELLRVLSKSSLRLKHSVVFLFNGAEEVGLLAAHLFLKHRWAESARVVLNLEAAGLGGRAVLFQSGPENGWIFQYYARNAPHPHGQILGEELFQNGFIPSDTDFRIFRDFGGMIGLDFAFHHNGYVYHTIYDREEYISGGSHQHMGDNILAVLRDLGNAKELEDMEAHREGSLVYFDYLGWFMVRYSFGVSVAINILVFALAVFSMVLFMWRLVTYSNESEDVEDNDTNGDVTLNNNGSPTPILEETSDKLKAGAACLEFFLSIVVRLCGMALTLGVNWLTALFIDAVSPLAMPYYSNVFLIFPFYWCPGLAAYALLPMLFDIFREKKCPLSMSMRCQLNLAASHCIWTLILLIFTSASIRSAAVFMVPVLFTSVALLLIYISPLYKTAYAWIWVYLLVNFPSLLYTMSLVLLGYVMAIPITGRSGTLSGDVYMAITSAVFVLYLTSFAIPLMSLVRRPWIVMMILTGFSFFMMAISLPTNIGHPYRKGPNHPTPQRYWIMHSDRKFFNENGGLRRHDWGYFVLNQDRNSPRTIPGNLTEGIVSLKDDCDTEMLCGLPFYSARMFPLSPGSSWIPTIDPPIQPVDTELTLREKACNSDYNNCTFDFSFSGPDRTTITFAPRENVVLDSWSLSAALVPTGTWQGRPAYLLRIVGGEIINDYQLQLNLNITNGDAARPLLDISVSGLHVHHEDNRTAAYQSFISDFPEYVSMMGWIASYTSFVF